MTNELDKTWAEEIEATAKPYADELQEAIFQHHDEAMVQIYAGHRVPGFYKHERQSWRVRVGRKWRAAIARVQDAWAVLLGRAEIRTDDDDRW